MKNLKQITIIIFLLIQGIVLGQEKTLETLKKKYTTLLKEQHNGVGVLVKKNNEINTFSMGDFDLNKNKVFNIGSATKTFTAILLLQEIEQGNLKLTDSIGSFLTPIQNVDGSLTIETLLIHESGLDDVIGKNIGTAFYAKNDSIYAINLLDNIGSNNPEMIGKHEYNNTNYLLLGKIIEKITDQSYFDLLRERIIEPLGLKHTYPYVYKSIPNLVTPYHNEKDVTEYLDYRYFAIIANAAGSIASTLTDMEKFYTSLFETEILLKNETVQQMMNKGSDDYGLGLMKSNHNGLTLYGHGGNNIGYSFSNAYNPETKSLFLVFSNTIRVPFKNAIKNDVFSYFDDKEIENFKTDIGLFKKYVGKYLLKEANMTFEILLEKDKLYLFVEAQGVKSQLLHKDETTLYDTTVGASLTLIKDDEDALTFSQNGFTTTIARINSDKN